MIAHLTIYMSNILLVFTGGTIGSQIDNGTIDTHQNAGFKLIELFRQQFSGQTDITFKTLQPLQILSENLHPQAWKKVLAAIEAEDLSQFDGVIVTHGTDTLAFSAALLSIYFHALNIPLLMVSSNFPLDNPSGNGLKNFICAVEFICNNPIRGVFVPYQNPGQIMHVHLGTRLSSCLPLSGDFISVQSRVFMTFADGRFQHVQANANVTTEPANAELKPLFGRILLIRPYPGLNYSNFDLTGVDAVLHDLYHSGTACVSRQWGDQHSLVEFSRHCLQKNVPLYLAPAIRSDSAYSSTRELLAHGATMLWSISLEAAFAKLALAYGNFQDNQKISEFLAANIAGEQI